MPAISIRDRVSRTFWTVLVKGGETYAFHWNRKTRTEVLRTVGNHAADPSLSFTWHDAAFVSALVRNS